MSWFSFFKRSLNQSKLNINFKLTLQINFKMFGYGYGGYGYGLGGYGFGGYYC